MWTAHTDADSAVPVDWLIRMCVAAAAGFDVVLGTVLPDDETPAAVNWLWHGNHQLVEGHRHVHGANFGISRKRMTVRVVNPERPGSTVKEKVSWQRRIRVPPGCVSPCRR